MAFVEPCQRGAVSSSCPADVYLPNWSAGRDAALDITVVNPLQQATVNEAAVTPGHSLNFAYDRKMRGAADDCERQGIVFQPLAFESLGGWHRAAVKEVKKIAKSAAMLSPASHCS